MSMPSTLIPGNARAIEIDDQPVPQATSATRPSPSRSFAAMSGRARDPVADEVRELRPVQGLLRLDDVGAVVRPVDALAGPIRLEQGRHRLRAAHDEPRDRRDEPRALGIDEDRGVAVRQRVAAGVRGRRWRRPRRGRPDRLVLEPLPRVARMDAGPLGQLGRGRGALLGQRAVQAEPVAEIDGLHVEGSQSRGHEAAGELVAAGLGGRGGVRGDGHGNALRLTWNGGVALGGMTPWNDAVPAGLLHDIVER